MKTQFTLRELINARPDPDFFNIILDHVHVIRRNIVFDVLGQSQVMQLQNLERFTLRELKTVITKQDVVFANEEEAVNNLFWCGTKSLLDFESLHPEHLEGVANTIVKEENRLGPEWKNFLGGTITGRASSTRNPFEEPAK